MRLNTIDALFAVIEDPTFFSHHPRDDQERKIGICNGIGYLVRDPGFGS